MSQHLRCLGFPEFNPEGSEEFSGFLNYLHDVFDQLDYKAGSLFSVGAYTVASVHIKGRHREEFMGLTATGGMLFLDTITLFKFKGKMISHIWMYKTKVTLITTKGNVFNLKKRLIL